ncbi:MAG: ThuA domain-containing protein [Steroidobacteraceae bacterium]
MIKPNKLLAMMLTTLLVAGSATAADSGAKKKRILLVTTSVGFRHPSVPYAEKALRDIAAQSGQFEIISTSDSPDFPVYPAPQEFELAGRADAGPDMSAMGMGAGPPGAPPGAAPNAGGPPMAGMGQGAGSDETTEKVRKVLAQYMSVKALKTYDAVFFVVTNGELPLPDAQGFLDWVKAGGGYMGSHSATDSLHGLPGYIEMVGAEFDHHGKQEILKLTNDDSKNVLTKGYTQGLVVDDEWYLFKSGYDRKKVHSLVSMTEHPNDKTAGHYPVSWCKSYGKGRVFYTSQGHRLDIWDANWVGNDGQRTNSKEAVAAFRSQMLEAMRWTTGLTKASCEP